MCENLVAAETTNSVTNPGGDVVAVNEVAILINKVKVKFVSGDSHVSKTTNGSVEEQTIWSARSQGIAIIAAMSNSNVANAVKNIMFKVVLVSMYVSADSIFLHQGNQARLQA